MQDLNTEDYKSLLLSCNTYNLPNLKRLICIFENLPYTPPISEEKRNVIIINKHCENTEKCETLSFSVFQGKKLCRDHFSKIVREFKHNLPPVLYKMVTGTTKENEMKNPITFRLLCNWCSQNEIYNLWEKMGENGRWENVKLVKEGEKYDYTVVINSTLEKIDKLKTIVFHMEPTGIPMEFVFPSFLRLFSHKYYNNLEWHLSWNRDELLFGGIMKDETLKNSVSAIVSSKYHDVGHINRVDFIKYAEQKIDFHIFGSNAFNYQNYKGTLPLYSKDNGLFPYYYTFAVENREMVNYVTEKLIDGILAECLVFYCGCPNIKDIIDDRAYVILDLENFDYDCQKIKKCIENDEWFTRLPYIKKEKTRILNELSFFPRVCKILNEIKE